VKHGFNGREGGKVSIRLDQDAADRYALTIEDDGNGLPPDIAEPDGLGSNVMRGLVAQLSGEITFSSAKGMTTRILFPAAA
jgi:two-component sensor histidine kinase